MKMKDNNYYARLIESCIRGAAMMVFFLDFLLIAVLLS